MQSLIDIFTRLVALEERVAKTFNFGKVTKVDPKTRRARMRLGGEDDKPYLSPEIPYAQTAGALKFHNPPSEGQQVMMISPDGDHRLAVMIPMTFSDDNPSPSEKGDEHVATFGDVTITMKGNEFTAKRGELEVSLGSDNKVTVKGPAVFKDPVIFEKGFTAKAGAGTGGAAGTFEGTLHATNDITSDTKVQAPTLQGNLTA